MSHTTPLRRAGRFLAATSAVAALTIVGCSAESDEPNAEGPGGEQTPVSYAISVQSAPNSLDPAQVVDGAQMMVWGSIMDTLLKRDPVSGEIVGNAAKEWSYNDDGTVLTLTLNEGMTFSDGTPVTAEAVAESMERTRATPGTVQAKFAQVTTIAAPDEHTLEITFDRFDPQFLANLALGAGAFGQPDALDDESVATDPVGSGPYTLNTEKSVPGTTYVLDKREDYWDAENIPFDTFTVRVMQDPTASLNALQSGEIDASTVQTQLVGQLDQNEFTITEVPATAIAVLDIIDKAGDKFPALGDLRVRQAINYAMDREGMVSGLFAGKGMATAQIFNPGGEVYDESLNATYPYDPEKGKELVEEAGFAGETFAIPSTFLSTSFEPAISDAFEGIGLSVDWEAVPPQQAQSAHLSGDYGMTFQIVGFGSQAGDAFYHFGESGFGNPLGYSDDTLASTFETINSTVDEAAALPAYQELNEYAVENALTVPLAFVSSTWAARDGYSYSTIGGQPMTVRAFIDGE